jgi:hypothetical protein
MYSSVDDVERARLRKLGEIDSLIGIAEGNLLALQAQRERLEKDHTGQSEAAQQAHIERMASDQLMLQAQLRRYREVREQAQAGFDRDSARIAVLLENRR